MEGLPQGSPRGGGPVPLEDACPPRNAPHVCPVRHQLRLREAAGGGTGPQPRLNPEVPHRLQPLPALPVEGSQGQSAAHPGRLGDRPLRRGGVLCAGEGIGDCARIHRGLHLRPAGGRGAHHEHDRQGQAEPRPAIGCTGACTARRGGRGVPRAWRERAAREGRSVGHFAAPAFRLLVSSARDTYVAVQQAWGGCWLYCGFSGCGDAVLAGLVRPRLRPAPRAAGGLQRIAAGAVAAAAPRCQRLASSNGTTVDRRRYHSRHDLRREHSDEDSGCGGVHSDLLHGALVGHGLRSGAAGGERGMEHSPGRGAHSSRLRVPIPKQEGANGAFGASAGGALPSGVPSVGERAVQCVQAAGRAGRGGCHAIGRTYRRGERERTTVTVTVDTVIIAPFSHLQFIHS
mmetsp:Transcript_16820/g.37327  ORF Transcript_16820/g.37327 Transcript_16820/m.37327 type:complete len:401 (+) Transcript_16820:282-1484(+)